MYTQYKIICYQGDLVTTRAEITRLHGEIKRLHVYETSCREKDAQLRALASEVINLKGDIWLLLIFIRKADFN